MKAHSDTKQLREVYQKLLSHYGPQGWWPLYNKETGRIEYHKGDYSFPKNEEQSFEISVGAILTQNTSWKNAQKALVTLKEQKKLDQKSIMSLSVENLARLIQSSGYHNQKAKKIKAFVTFLTTQEDLTREDVLRVWGVGQETADSILLYAHKQPFFVVDAYTKRILSRVGLCNEHASYEDVQALFHDTLLRDVEVYNEYHALLVEHAKQHCTKTPKCTTCPLNNICLYARTH